MVAGSALSSFQSLRGKKALKLSSGGIWSKARELWHTPYLAVLGLVLPCPDITKSAGPRNSAFFPVHCVMSPARLEYSTYR